ncbi:MAG: hypothetical protein HY040_01110 [Planctomycetes bacterium]|nr:hypothetical protein [Planctomycetota bacterium]
MPAGTPNGDNWRWYQDDAAEPSTALAGENTAPALSDNTSIVRLRLAWKCSGGTVAGATATLEYSTDDTNFTALGSGNAWNYANGQGTNGNTTTTFKTSTGTVHGVYAEDALQSDTGGSTNAVIEMDWAIKPTGTVAAGTLYYFRQKHGGTVITLGSGKTHAQITTEANASGLIYARFCQHVPIEPFAGNVIRSRLFAGSVPKADARIIRRICKLVEYGPYAGHVIRQKPRGTNTVISPGFGLPRRAKHAAEPVFQWVGWRPKYVWRLKPISVDFNPTKILEMILAANSQEKITIVNHDQITMTLESNNTVNLSLRYGQTPTLTLRYQTQIDLTIAD